MNRLSLPIGRGALEAVSASAPRAIADRILEEVQRSPDCELDALVQNLPEFTWEDVLLEVHRLSGMGQLQLNPWGAGIYTVRLTRDPAARKGLMSAPG